MSSWDTLFDEASNFATSIGKERLISISHSEDNNDGVVVVWYWDQLPPRRDAVELSQIEREIEENQ